jgi:putative transcriptional regulator
MVRIKLNPKHLPRGRTDWQRLRDMSDRQVLRAARSDPDAQPLTAAQLARMRRVPDVRSIRRQLRMTQAQFAEAFGLAVGTIRDWEQGRFVPDGPARVLLTLIEKKPMLIKQLLHKRSPRPDAARRHREKKKSAR